MSNAPARHTPQLHTSEDAAARFHMKPQAFRDLARKHSIPYVAAGRRILFTEAALVQLQEALTCRSISKNPVRGVARTGASVGLTSESELTKAQEALTAALPAGAIYANGEDEAVWQQWEELGGGADAMPRDFAGYTPSEPLEYMIRAQSALRWRPFDQANEGSGIVAQVMRKTKAGKR